MAIARIKSPDMDSYGRSRKTDETLESFFEYREVVQPYLERAFNEALSLILGNIAQQKSNNFLVSLQSGKKIRGTLACLICESLGGSLGLAIPRATAVELIHAATLIHDDFVDQDTTRRNFPAVWTIEGARRAVLIGDVIFSSAIEAMSLMGKEDGLAVSTAIAEISKGALREPLDYMVLAHEIEAGKKIGGLYEDIIRLKTGILFGAACSLGAIAADVNGIIRDAFREYGLRIGEAYQIADDLHDVRRYLAGEPFRPEQIAVLAPALLRFSEDAHPVILALMTGETNVVGKQSRELFVASAELMERAIEDRLKAAVSILDESFTGKNFSRILQLTPFEIIAMFNKVLSAF